MKKPCHDCVQRGTIGGNYHIFCNNPPGKQMEIGHGGDERYQIAKEMAEENDAVVRVIWGGSGVFPVGYDPDTVFACINFTTNDKERIERERTPIEQMMALM
jgi:hypothetical protein